jgi:hypothetical protein
VLRFGGPPCVRIIPGKLKRVVRTTGRQDDHHYRLELGADIGTTIDVLHENERLGDVLDRIVTS